MSQLYLNYLSLYLIIMQAFVLILPSNLLPLRMLPDGDKISVPFSDLPLHSSLVDVSFRPNLRPSLLSLRMLLDGDTFRSIFRTTPHISFHIPSFTFFFQGFHLFFFSRISSLLLSRIFFFLRISSFLLSRLRFSSVLLSRLKI